MDEIVGGDGRRGGGRAGRTLPVSGSTSMTSSPSSSVSPSGSPRIRFGSWATGVPLGKRKPSTCR